MFQQMISASRAVLLRPAVATFEEHEQNNLQWATIYVAIGAVITAILGMIAFTIQRPYIEQQLREAEQQFGGQLPLASAMAEQSLLGATINNLLSTLLGFFIFLGLVYLLGRAFGGTGNFGELAYDISLFWAPLMVLNALISVVAIGPVMYVTGLVSLAVLVYNLYLTYLGIQSGMNLPSNKALYVILILVAIGVVLAVCVAVVFAAAFATMMNAGGR